MRARRTHANRHHAVQGKEAIASIAGCDDCTAEHEYCDETEQVCLCDDGCAAACALRSARHAPATDTTIRYYPVGFACVKGAAASLALSALLLLAAALVVLLAN